MKLKSNRFLAARFTSITALRVVGAISAIALMAFDFANAAPVTWIGNTDTNWNTAANWSALPVTDDNFIFNTAGTAGTTLSNNLTTSGFNIAGINFSATASAYTINGNDFTLTGNISNSSTTNPQIINTNMTLSGARTVTTTTVGGVTLGGNLTGGSLTKAGAGTLTLSGTSSVGYVNYSAAGTITNSGSLTLNASTTGTATAATIFNNSGMLTTSGNVQIANLGTSISPSAAALVGGNNGTFNQTAGTVSFTSASGGFGSGLNIAFRSSTGAYNLSGGTLNVVNSATQISQGGSALGTLAISGGTANLQGIAMTGSTSGSATINLTGGRLNIGSAGIVSGTAAGTQAINLGAGTVGAFADWSTAKDISLTNAATGVTFNTLDSVDNTTGRTITLSGALSNTGKLVKAGAGTLILSGTNTYSGATNISAGTLAINGNSSAAAGAVTVASGAILGGTGSIGGTVSIAGVLAPGASIESLGTGALSFGATSTFAYELDSSALNGDLVDSTGTLDITPGAVLTLTQLASGSLASNSKLTLISYAGGWVNTELFTYLGSTLNDGDTITLGVNKWQFDYNDTAGGSNYASDQVGATSFITMTVVPEPSAALLGGLGMLCLLRRRRA
jgi:fibronectin-binding autotransporter adhesin